jgi:hypothetical protein
MGDEKIVRVLKSEFKKAKRKEIYLRTLMLWLKRFVDKNVQCVESSSEYVFSFSEERQAMYGTMLLNQVIRDGYPSRTLFS